MRIFGLDIRRARGSIQSPAPALGSGGWFPLVVREPTTGAWQRNEEIRPDSVLGYAPVFACVTLIASDVGKVRLRLVEVDADGIWTETTSPAFSPVLRKPNAYQTTQKLIEQWITSKLIHGNTYALKQRDDRGVVRGLYVLDPTRVTPLVAPDGSVFYQLTRDDLAGLDAPTLDARGGTIAVPAREIIHDPAVALFHPLIGVSPIFACGLAALQGLRIQGTSAQFFANGSAPGGVLTAPGAIGKENAQRLKTYWETEFSGDNVGKIAVLGDGLKFEALSVNAVDAQLVEQLKWSAETVCSCFHVPPYMIGVGPPPPYANVEPLVQQYYAQCLQTLFTALEISLDEGLDLPAPYGTEFDIDDLIWMDTATRTAAAKDAIGSGALSPDEARKKYYGLGRVQGGDTPYLQQQYFSLAALSERTLTAPAPPTPAAPPPEADAAPADEDTTITAALAAIDRKAVEVGLYAS